MDLSRERERLLRDLAVYRSLVEKTSEAINQTTTIYRLPTEVLAYILEYCTYPKWEGEHWTPKHWLATTTHVCKRLRIVALDIPSLWSQITLPGNQSYIQTALQRSKSCHLNVSLPPRRSADDEVTTLFIQLLPRTKRLDFHGSLSRPLPQDLVVPHLQTLVLGDIMAMQVPLSSDIAYLFRAAHSVLRTVNIPSIAGIWPELGACTRLENLVLGYSGLQGLQLGPTLDELVGNLRHLISLKTLKLRCNLRKSTCKVGPVHLPNLEFIALSTAVATENIDILTLLSHITFPTLTRVDLSDTFPCNIRTGEVTPAFTSVAENIIAPRIKQHGPLRTVAFASDMLACPPYHLCISGWVVKVSSPIGTIDPLFSLPLDVRSMDVLAPHLPLDLVRTVHIQGFPPFGSKQLDILSYAIGYLTNIEELYLLQCDTSMFDRLFGNDEQPPLFPSLHTLRIDSGQILDCESPQPSELCRGCHHVLARAFRGGCGSEKSRRRLLISQSTWLAPQQVEFLSQHVDRSVQFKMCPRDVLYEL